VSDEYRAYTWREPELVAVPSRHGAPSPIHARLYLPDGFDPERPEPYPAAVFIHGAGYLQDAYDGWSYYFREHMFHELLARRGWVSISMDYRGSAGYGRDWRTAIYRHMGGPEVEDLADGVAWLARTKNVDPARVGVYGGSYGGFLTLMALFQEPGLFAAGASWRPVTDWAHYNHPYTSNILNTPDIDPEAYERSSPIEHAEGLADPLVIIHGMQDDNVLFQDTVRLAQRLIELEKEDWWVAMYPIEPHAFQEPESWLDAMRRILALFEREAGTRAAGEAVPAGSSP
ncbi:MAG TPA: prolyl oligopeptidase family serine peptidase, partial [Thermoanaerobaculia bacterium]